MKENDIKEEKLKEEVVESIEEVETEIEGKLKKIKKEVFDKEAWQPKTAIGKKCKSGEIKKIDEILDNGIKILEEGIVDLLVPNLETDLLLVGQSKGKFGGGQRRVFRQTQKKTQDGNKPKFSALAVIGNRGGFIGVGFGKAKETVPAREKAMRNAKLNLIKIKRGCGSWQCGCNEHHSVPFKIKGKCGSATIELIPAPKGTGLCVEKECAKVLALAGIKDVWSKTRGKTGTKINLIYACIDALKKIIEIKVQDKYNKELKIIEGMV